MSQPVRLFLDANVLFSAAYRRDAGVRKLWDLRGVVLLSSTYAAVEARRTLDEPAQREELEVLLASVEFPEAFREPDEVTDHSEMKEAGLPEKDLPILRAAVAAGATHLITGDRTHFGHLYGRIIAGVRISRPADDLRDAV